MKLGGACHHKIVCAGRQAAQIPSEAPSTGSGLPSPGPAGNRFSTSSPVLESRSRARGPRGTAERTPPGEDAARVPFPAELERSRGPYESLGGCHPAPGNRRICDRASLAEALGTALSTSRHLVPLLSVDADPRLTTAVYSLMKPERRRCHTYRSLRLQVPEPPGRRAPRSPAGPGVPGSGPREQEGHGRGPGGAPAPAAPQLHSVPAEGPRPGPAWWPSTLGVGHDPQLGPRDAAAAEGPRDRPRSVSGRRQGVCRDTPSPLPDATGAQRGQGLGETPRRASRRAPPSPGSGFCPLRLPGPGTSSPRFSLTWGALTGPLPQPPAPTMRPAARTAAGVMFKSCGVTPPLWRSDASRGRAEGNPRL